MVATRWHQQVSDGLLAGAERALRGCTVDDVAVVRVPGAFELPGHCAGSCRGPLRRGGCPWGRHQRGDAALRVRLSRRLGRSRPGRCRHRRPGRVRPRVTCETIEQALDRGRDFPPARARTRDGRPPWPRSRPPSCCAGCAAARCMPRRTGAELVRHRLVRVIRLRGHPRAVARPAEGLPGTPGARSVQRCRPHGHSRRRAGLPRAGSTTRGSIGCGSFGHRRSRRTSSRAIFDLRDLGS